MKKPNFICTVLFLGLMIFGSNVVSAQMQIPQNITFVSANGGSDANSCSRSAPCRQIQRGINTVSRGGTVIVLDSGEYSAFTITKSVNVIAEKGVSAIVRIAQGGVGAKIEDDPASPQIITIRGLTFLGRGNNSSEQGIWVVDPITSLTVEDCSITDTFRGIEVYGAGRYAFRNIKVTRSVFSGVVFISSGTVVATIEDSSFEQNGTFGVDLNGSDSSLTVRNSLAAYNPTGFGASGSSKMFVENSLATNNTYGITSSLGATVSVSNSTITHNGTGFRNYSSTFRTFGNNSFANNSVANTVGTILSVSQQ